MKFRPLLGKMKKEGGGKNRMKGEGNITENTTGELSRSVQLKLLSPRGNTSFHILLPIANAEVVKE